MRMSFMWNGGDGNDFLAGIKRREEKIFLEQWEGTDGKILYKLGCVEEMGKSPYR